IEQLGFDVSFSKNSNSSSVPQMRNFLQGAKKYITYLPFDSPEYFILQKNSLCNEFLSNNEAKQCFKQLSISLYGEDDSDAKAILLTQLKYLNRIDYNCQEFMEIRKLLKFYLAHSTINNWNK
ncbi:hypothetical protein ABN128_33125, partial [Klebsiella variicola subsp. variicola]